MLDITEKSSEADGRLIAFKAKRDGKDEDAYIFEADVQFEVKTIADARILGKTIPGAEAIFVRAQHPDDNWKFRTSVVPDVSARAEISHAAKGKVAVKGLAEVRGIRLSASKKAVVASFKLLLGGQTASVATGLTNLLGETVCCSVESQQQILPFAAGGVHPEVGQVITAFDADTGDQYVGVLKEEVDGGESLVLEDFGESYIVEPDQVIAAFSLDGDVKPLLKSYRERCKRRDLAPTWEALVMAIAEDWSGALSGSAKEPFTLTAQTIEKAVTRLETGNGTLPEREAVAG